MTKQYRTPDGKWTTDWEKYLKEWHEVIDAWGQMGFHVTGFDPGITMVDACNTDSPWFYVPMWASKKILKRMKK